MAKVLVIDCDRCGARIREEDARMRLGSLDFRVGDKVLKRDLCASCGSALELFLRGASPASEDEAPGMDEALNDELRRVREVANTGIERYADGANAHELVGVLRDVASSARRSP